MINIDQGYRAKIDMGLEEGDDVSIFFRDKQGGIKLAWDGDIPVLRVFLIDAELDNKVAVTPDRWFRFVNETTGG